ncbi:MAG: MBL fold metallo-hydrolase [Actinobacteria bacterium]|nr:MAG: MBL fold metallo-hydrolase [Actinomycetota bacterium]
MSAKQPSPAVRVVFLGSGSSGNATAIAWPGGAVLIDCGFSASDTERRLQHAGIEPSSVLALLVTHEHIDHVRGVDVFARRHGVPVYASAGTIRSDRLGTALPELVRVRAGEPFRVDGASVLPVRVSHDAAEPLCFVLEAPGGTRVGIATDTGTLTSECAEALAGCRIIGIECNHDLDMLRTGRYPAFLKSRILSDHGHLSNPDAARALEAVASDVTEHVVGLHLSSENNTAELARRALAAAARSLGLTATVAALAQGARPLAVQAGGAGPR